MSGLSAQGSPGEQIDAPLLRVAGEVLRARSEREAILHTGEAVHGLGWGRVRVGLFENWQMIAESLSGHDGVRWLGGHPSGSWGERFGLSCARFRIGRSYLVHAGGLHSSRDWRDGDEAYVPIESAFGGVMGVIELRDPVSRLRPVAAEFEAVEFLADLCARTLESLRRRQGERLELVGRVAEGMAHDFNNILTVVRGEAALAERALERGHPAMGALGRVESAVEHASEIVGSLLEYTRSAEFERSDLDLRALVQATVPLLDKITPSSIEIVFSADSDHEVLVEASSTRIRQLLVNLVLNARDAMGGRGRIEIALGSGSGVGSNVGSGVCLSIRDSGVGMGSESVALAFDRSYSMRDGGSGLGLGLVRDIVHEHAGHIELSSVPGEGTTVVIGLPLLREARRHAA